jgi:hypothetical protein
VHAVFGEAPIVSRNIPINLKTAVKPGKVKKFLVTYASFERLVSCLGNKAKNCQLLIDEAHMLASADAKNYMYVQIRKILANYTEFKSFYFVTSTSYHKECFPDERVHGPMYKAKWEPLTPISLICTTSQGQL